MYSNCPHSLILTLFHCLDLTADDLQNGNVFHPDFTQCILVDWIDWIKLETASKIYLKFNQLSLLDSVDFKIVCMLGIRWTNSTSIVFAKLVLHMYNIHNYKGNWPTLLLILPYTTNKEIAKYSSWV